MKPRIPDTRPCRSCRSVWPAAASNHDQQLCRCGTAEAHPSGTQQRPHRPHRVVGVAARRRAGARCGHAQGDRHRRRRHRTGVVRDDVDVQPRVRYPAQSRFARHRCAARPGHRVGCVPVLVGDRQAHADPCRHRRRGLRNRSRRGPAARDTAEPLRPLTESRHRARRGTVRHRRTAHGHRLVRVQARSATPACVTNAGRLGGIGQPGRAG